MTRTTKEAKEKIAKFWAMKQDKRCMLESVVL
jgi:hypothetical protein